MCGAVSVGRLDPMDPVRYQPIAEYAFLADCHSTALVSRAGSVDWACFRRFDAPSVFGRLLDHDRGGHFSITPTADATWTREYVDATLVLDTAITTPTGSAVLREAMVMHEGGADHPHHQLVRRVVGIEGTVEFDVEVAPRFEYGLTRPLLRDHGKGAHSALGGAEVIVIHTDAPLSIDDEGARLVGRFSVSAGERVRFCLTSQPAHRLEPHCCLPDDIDAHLDETIAWWQRWARRLVVDGPYAELCRRSAVVLKGLTCAPTGAVIAAATTSLPEEEGAAANWDYRYSWVRDSSLVLEALAHVGHPEVAQGFRDFLLRSAAGRANDLQIMYGPYGERRLTEYELELEGLRGSRPVRVGNAAAFQTQLDVYGHLLDAVDTWHEAGDEIDPDERRFLCDAVDLAARRWHEPDQGMWEVRGPARHFVHSKVMCWVALARGIGMASDLDVDDERLSRWKTAADEVRDAVMTHGVDPVAGHFRQHFDTDEVDASLLKLPLVGFVEADDPRMVATVAAVQRHLAIQPSGFVHRYRTDGGDREGVFLLCSFWLVENLALQGKRDEAIALFGRLAAAASDVGLYAEQLQPSTGEQLGNFPQAFTHLGLVSAAARLWSRSPITPTG